MLVFTSLLFLVPAYSLRVQLCSCLCYTLVVTSCAYHVTHDERVRIADVLVCHVLWIASMYTAIAHSNACAFATAAVVAATVPGVNYATHRYSPSHSYARGDAPPSIPSTHGAACACVAPSRSREPLLALARLAVTEGTTRARVLCTLCWGTEGAFPPRAPRQPRHALDGGDPFRDARVWEEEFAEEEGVGDLRHRR